MVKEDAILALSVCGGALPFDFLNTVGGWIPARGNEYLKTYHDFLLWTRRIGILSKDEENRLARRTKARSFRPGSSLKFVHKTRDVLFNVFEEISAAQRTGDESLNALSDLLRKAHARKILINTPGKTSIRFSGENPEYFPLWYILLEAEKLVLDQSRWPRIRMCPACGWFFLDTSKGGKRRWCDMAVCGSRDKALRYYHNTKR